jgi:hypothetical protein
MGSVALLYWLFLIPHPAKVGLIINEELDNMPIVPEGNHEK